MFNNIQLTLRKRLKIILPFWVLIVGYFIILEWVEPIPSPIWIAWVDQFIPFIWWMIIPYYFHYIGLILPPLLFKNKSKLIILRETSILITLVCYMSFIIWPISASVVWNVIEPNHLDLLYSILLKNLDNRRAIAEVSIDGTDVLDGRRLVIDGNDDTELKGVMVNNAVKNAFKFIQKNRKNPRSSW